MLKLRTRQGKVALFSAYAPPQTPNHPFEERQKFFNDLSTLFTSTSCNGPKLILGDLNARLHVILPGEENIIGPNIVQHASAQLHAHMNRYQLVQLCSECELQVMNTFTQHALEDLVTYKEIWHQKHNAITAPNHELLDLILAPRTHAYRVSGLRCLSAFALKSHHAVVMAHFNVDLSKAKQLHAQQKPDISLLRDFRIRQSFSQIVESKMHESVQNGASHDSDLFLQCLARCFQDSSRNLSRAASGAEEAAMDLGSHCELHSSTKLRKISM